MAFFVLDFLVRQLSRESYESYQRGGAVEYKTMYVSYSHSVHLLLGSMVAAPHDLPPPFPRPGGVLVPRTTTPRARRLIPSRLLLAECFIG